MSRAYVTSERKRASRAEPSPPSSSPQRLSSPWFVLPKRVCAPLAFCSRCSSVFPPFQLATVSACTLEENERKYSPSGRIARVVCCSKEGTRKIITGIDGHNVHGQTLRARRLMEIVPGHGKAFFFVAIFLSCRVCVARTGVGPRDGKVEGEGGGEAILCSCFFGACARTIRLF